jgi:hypothetical protein
MSKELERLRCQVHIWEMEGQLGLEHTSSFLDDGLGEPVRYIDLVRQLRDLEERAKHRRTIVNAWKGWIVLLFCPAVALTTYGSVAGGWSDTMRGWPEWSCGIGFIFCFLTLFALVPLIFEYIP